MKVIGYTIHLQDSEREMEIAKEEMAKMAEILGVDKKDIYPITKKKK